jgi:hypothetical protein
MKLQIIRTISDAKQTLGEASVINNQGQTIFAFKTLELPWKNNQQKTSCIPKGIYECVKRVSPRYKMHFHVTNVPARSWILIHHGNFYHDIEGCILPGRTHADIDGDGYRDVTHSRQTMIKLLELLPAKFELQII